MDAHGHAEAMVSPMWDVALVLLVASAVTGYALVLRWRYRYGTTPGWSSDLSFAAALACLLLALGSPVVSSVGQGSHLAFMWQMEVLVTVVPVLVLLGLRPVLPRVGRGPALASALAPALGVWVAAIYVPHLPPVHDLVMGSPVAYALQLLFFLAAGLVFWWPLVVGDGARLADGLVYLAVAQAGAGVLAAALIWAPEPFYAHAHGTLPFGLSPLADQKLAGALMMLTDMLVASTVAGWLVVRALSASTRLPSRTSEGAASWRGT